MATIRERQDAEGHLSYQVQVRLRGSGTQTATFRRKSDARRWGTNTEAALREGRYFTHNEAKRHTVAEALDRYEREILPRKRASTAGSQTSMLKWWKREIGPLTMADVAAPIIVEKRSKLLAQPRRQGGKRCNAVGNRYMALLSHVFSIAEREWGWAQANPCRRVSKLPEPRGRVRWLGDAERKALLDACKTVSQPALLPIVIVALSTGMRMGEIVNLKWADVDFERRRIIILITKNGRPRTVPLVGRALETLSKWGRVRRLDTTLVFPGAPRPDGPQPLNFRAAWLEAVKKAKLTDFRFHDLRHCAASYLAMSGASQREIMEVCGHLTPAMSAKYTHLADQHLTGVVERMNADIFDR